MFIELDRIHDHFHGGAASEAVEPLRWACVSGVKVTFSSPLLPGAATEPPLTMPGLPAARTGADAGLAQAPITATTS